MRHVLLLRGVNVGTSRRIAMPWLREAMTAAGHVDVSTYLQSGNVVLSSDSAPAEVARDCERLLAREAGVEVEVVVRTRDELAEVVRRDPLGDVAQEPKHYLVSFLSAEPEPAVVERVAGLATGGERLVAHGRELYAWLPGGAGRSKLAAQMAGTRLGVAATARNWRTVTALLDLASG